MSVRQRKNSECPGGFKPQTCGFCPLIRYHWATRLFFLCPTLVTRRKNISLVAVLLMMGHFSCECLYIKTNVITATNHTKVKCYKKPLRTQRQNMLTTWGAGKCHRPIRDWFKFASDWSVSGYKSFSDQSTIIFQFRVLIRRRLPSRLIFLVVQARIFWLQSWNV